MIPDEGTRQSFLDMLEVLFVRPEDRLPKPFYEDSFVVLYNADCRDVLPKLPSVDLVLADPPYGHAEKWSGGTWAANPIYDAAFDWDASPFPEDTIKQIVNAGRRCIVWGGNYYSLPPSRFWLAWEKTSKLPTMADFELAWTNLNKPSKVFLCDRNPDGKRAHPTEKPLALMRWSILLAGEVRSLIDPCCGSGKSLIAAKQLGVKATGIEINPAYCQLAADRLRHTTPSLFAPPPPKPEQLPLLETP